MANPAPSRTPPVSPRQILLIRLADHLTGLLAEAVAALQPRMAGWLARRPAFFLTRPDPADPVYAEMAEALADSLGRHLPRVGHLPMAFDLPTAGTDPDTRLTRLEIHVDPAVPSSIFRSRHVARLQFLASDLVGWAANPHRSAAGWRHELAALVHHEVDHLFLSHGRLNGAADRLDRGSGHSPLGRYGVLAELQAYARGAAASLYYDEVPAARFDLEGLRGQICHAAAFWHTLFVLFDQVDVPVVPGGRSTRTIHRLACRLTGRCLRQLHAVLGAGADGNAVAAGVL